MKPFGAKLLMAQQSGYVFFRCPGCKEDHAITVGPNGWTWNGDGDRPTFTPSVLVTGTLPIKDEDHAAWMRDRTPLPPPIPYACHSFVTDGRIQFRSDCTHALAGQTVDLPDWREE